MQAMMGAITYENWIAHTRQIQAGNKSITVAVSDQATLDYITEEPLDDQSRLRLRSGTGKNYLEGRRMILCSKPVERETMTTYRGSSLIVTLKANSLAIREKRPGMRIPSSQFEISYTAIFELAMKLEARRAEADKPKRRLWWDSPDSPGRRFRSVRDPGLHGSSCPRSP